MSKLTIHENERSTVYEILEDSLVIGSRQGSAIRLSDAAASAEHCQVTLVPGVGYKLIDLESREGTKVNGAYVNQHLLREGDVIQIGGVRIGFAGEAPVAAVPGAAPAAAPVAARPAAPARPVPAAPARPAAQARPARPAARQQYAGYASAPPRDYRPPRRRGGDNGTIIMMGAAVGLLLIVVVIALVISSGSASGNEKVLMDMEQLISRGQYDAAIARAAQADPNGDQRILAKIGLQKLAAKNLKSKKGGMNASNQALRAYQQVESWIQKHRHDIQGTIVQWEALVRDHAGTHWAFKAQGHIDHLRSGGKNPEGIVLYPGGGATIDRGFTEVQTRAKTLEDEDKFQAAIDAFFDFWEEYKLKTTDLSTWEKKVQDEVKGVERRAEDRWDSLDSLAKQYVKNGEYDAATRMYRKITDNFGIEKYTVQADAAIKKIRR